MAMLEDAGSSANRFILTQNPACRPASSTSPGPARWSASWMSSRAWTSPSNKGDVVAILGPSGSGKTTLLRCLNFLETTDSGTLIFDGEAV